MSRRRRIPCRLAGSSEAPIRDVEAEAPAILQTGYRTPVKELVLRPLDARVAVGDKFAGSYYREAARIFLDGLGFDLSTICRAAARIIILDEIILLLSSFPLKLIEILLQNLLLLFEEFI